jgi:cytochrome P450
MGKVVDESLAFISSRIRNPFALPARWQIVPSHKHFWQQRELLDSYLYKLIRERRADLDASTQTRKHDLLEMLLLARDEASGEGMNDEQIRNEVATIYGAGHETTALALTWAFYALSQNPQVWQKLCDEVARVLNGRTPTLADLPNLPYSLAVFEETLRLYPPVPLTVRFAYDDCQVSNYLIRKGEMCAIGIRNIHRHPDFWHNPVQFEPERFLPQNKAKLNRTAYLPFLTGPHICIGNNFALMEGQLLLAMIAQRYNVQVLPNQHIVPELAVTMRPKHGVMVNLRKKSTSI